MAHVSEQRIEMAKYRCESQTVEAMLTSDDVTKTIMAATLGSIYAILNNEEVYDYKRQEWLPKIDEPETQPCDDCGTPTKIEWRYCVVCAEKRREELLRI